jgi:lysozyme
MRRALLLVGLVLGLTACGSGRKFDGPTYVPPNPSKVSYPSTLKFGDYDPWDWTGTTPSNYAVHGIDVSRWQTYIDWSRAKNAGVAFAFIKATEGGDFLDPKFHEHRNGARKAGMRYGAYHYYYFCRPAHEQAAWFIRNVPKDPHSLPHVLDMEWTPKSKTCTYRPDGATVRAEARKFLDILERHYGKRPIIYTTPDFYKETGIGKMYGETFWLRSVAGHPRKTYPGARWTFWQYTGTGSVPGINGKVDLNVFAGAEESFASWGR